MDLIVWTCAGESAHCGLNEDMPLVIAASPIGDPGDASPRFRAAMATADVIAAEDTRRLRRLLSSLEVEPVGRVIAVYDAVERGRAGALLDQVEAGQTVVLVSDAGMPLVSDPGHVLVAGAFERGLRVTVLPGPSAVTAAVAICGLPVDRWCFEGFLPRKSGERRTRLAELAHDRRALVIFESPRRLGATLADLVIGFGADRPAAVCRELSKTYEEVRRGTLEELAGWAASNEVLGEITVVVAGASGDVGPIEPDELNSEVQSLVDAGMTRRDAVDAVAGSRGVSRRVVYDAANRPKSSGPA
jgi:16S rRNA (cytidine1402-2'-O)-methyltransferase